LRPAKVPANLNEDCLFAFLAVIKSLAAVVRSGNWAGRPANFSRGCCQIHPASQIADGGGDVTRRLPSSRDARASFLVSYLTLERDIDPGVLPPVYRGSIAVQRPRSKTGIDVTLRCPFTGEYFIFTAPRDPKWLSEYWNKKRKMRCRECGSAHAYDLRHAYLVEALKTRTVFEVPA
jgi:hypothetical protein